MGLGSGNQYIVNGSNVTDGALWRLRDLQPGVWPVRQRVTSIHPGSSGQTGGFEAQYGQALGGVINVITKSGTNDLQWFVLRLISRRSSSKPHGRTPIRAAHQE